MKTIDRGELVRCKYWVVCDIESCDHYQVHQAGNACIALQPVKYCRRMKGFVHDVHISQIDSNYECDPNLAFKAKVDADRRREKDYKKAMNHRRNREYYENGDGLPWHEDGDDNERESAESIRQRADRIAAEILRRRRS